MEFYESNFSQLRASIDEFYKILSDSNEWKSAPLDLLSLQETTNSDLSIFIENQDKHYPKMNLAQAVGSSRRIFELMHEAGDELFGSEQTATVLPQLYGLLRTVLLHGHRKFGSPRFPSKLLEEFGRHARTSDFESCEFVIKDVWGYYCMVSQEFVAIGSAYISEGVYLAYKSHNLFKFLTNYRPRRCYEKFIVFHTSNSPSPVPLQIRISRRKINQRSAEGSNKGYLRWVQR